MRFFKVHGNGNDFVVLDNRDGHICTEELRRMAVPLCRRKTSVGADGVLVMESAEGYDFRMRLFNADGSEGEMCGNGARALARCALHIGAAGREMRFITLAGEIRASVQPPFAELDMGVIDLSSGVFGERIAACGLEFPYVSLTVGVPHCVLLTDEEYGRDTVFEAGRAIRQRADLFPHGTNVNFLRRLPGGSLSAITYERGVEDITESCGTGSTACAIAANIVWGCGTEIDVHNPGGVNSVRLDFADDGKSVHAYLRGRTAIVAEGELLEEAFFN